jgi:hypothetical protein
MPCKSCIHVLKAKKSRGKNKIKNKKEVYRLAEVKHV